MESYQNNRPKLKKKMLSTRRKMKVLTALHSGSKTSLPDSSLKKDDISDHGREVMALLQSEQSYIEVLKELKKILTHPVLKGNVKSLDDIISLIDEMLIMHTNLHKTLVCGKSNLSDSLKQLTTVLDVYVSYSILINIESTNCQEHFELMSNNKMEVIDLLNEPLSHIFRYIPVFENLYAAKPNEAYSDFLKAVQCTFEKIKKVSSLKKNAIKTLQIQRFLVNRKPKILSPGRILLKEGILYKVGSQGRTMKKRIFFLFHDIFLCCKMLSDTFSFQEKDSLLFSTLFPLNLCSVHFVMGSSTNNGGLFKVTCGSLSYLLLSKIPGESTIWVQELQAAIRMCQCPSSEMKSKLIRRQHVYIKQKMSPILSKSAVLEDAAKVENMDISDLHSKSSSFRKLLKLLTCLKL